MKLLRPLEVAERVGLSRTTIWRREREGTFPARRRLGANSVAYIEAEVDKWIENRPTIQLDRGDANA